MELLRLKIPISDTEKEELLVQVNTLRYELENFKQERDLMVLHHEKELRDLQLKADSDFRKAQVRSLLPILCQFLFFLILTI